MLKGLFLSKMGGDGDEIEGAFGTLVGRLVGSEGLHWQSEGLLTTPILIWFRSIISLYT